MTDQDSPTPVIFRTFRTPADTIRGFAWQDDVIALFPTIPLDIEGKYMLSYMYVGQHGGANYRFLLQTTRPATEPEYAPLKEELKRGGYTLLVCRRVEPWLTRQYDIAVKEAREL